MLFPVLLLFLSLSFVIRAEELKCGKNSDKFADEIFARTVAFGKYSRRVPEKEENLNSFCGSTFADIKTLENYSKRCKKGIAKQFFSIMLFTSRNQYTRLCKKDPKLRSRFLSASKCINKASDEFEKCHTVMIEKLLGIKFAEEKLKIPLTCCGNYELKNCYREAAKRIDICTDEHLETIDSFAGSITMNADNLFCGEYSDDSDKCEKLGEPPKRRKNQKITRSFFLPIIDVFNSFREV